jgi:iron uptake system component EfeO
MYRLAFIALAACGSGLTDAEQQKKIADGMHASLLADIRALKAAAQELKATAPVTPGRGWDPGADAQAITAMKARWYEARTAYEHIEGAIAPLFPDVDAAIDERYDGFLEGLGATGDQNLFDGAGVTGMHAVERILWSDSIPAGVTRVESTLPGYRAAAFPATEKEAKDFRDQLVTQLIADVQNLEEQWSPAKIDLAGAFQGLEDLMSEQREKVNNASNNLEESRYSQRTMRDLRDNLDGTRTIYALFQPWLKTKNGAHQGAEVDQAITAGFDALATAYGEVTGEAIPPPPSTWSAEAPSITDLQTPFGKLWSKVRDATDPGKDGSVVDQMSDAGALMGFPASL